MAGGGGFNGLRSVVSQAGALNGSGNSLSSSFQPQNIYSENAYQPNGLGYTTYGQTAQSNPSQTPPPFDPNNTSFNIYPSSSVNTNTGPQSTTPTDQAYPGIGSPPGGDMAGRYEIKKMAGGGLTSVAKQLSTKGRGKDKMLVHMTPREVAGLQALAKAKGGSLTINPDTGLVEAGFLDRLLPTLLPMAAGAALTVGSGGALSPLAASMIVGGGYGLATGSVEKGLMAGLGSYGGAGMASGLGSAGAAQTAADAQTAALNAGNAANAGVIPQPPPIPGMTPPPQATPIPGSDSISTAFNLPAAPQATPFPTAQVTPNAGVYTGDLAAFNPAQQNSIIAQRNAVMSTPGIENITAQPTGGISGGQMANNVQQGFGQLGNEAGRSAVYNALPTGTLPATATPIVASMMEPKNAEGLTPEEYKRKYPELTLSDDFRGSSPTRPNPYYRPAGMGYAQGGLMDLNTMPGISFDDAAGVDAYAAGGIADAKKKKATRTSAAKLAAMSPLEAGLAQLNNARAMAQMRGDVAMPKRSMEDLGVVNAAKGRYLKGDGDGMSDSIPATINGRQPARLADGEFVVPADVVSHLGNGSSDAGAKKLYKMMDNIRVARTGKKKQARAVKADKYMPA